MKHEKQTEQVKSSPAAASDANPQGELQQQVDESPKQLIGSEIVQQVANKTGLPDKLKSGIESISGVDLSEVRVHRNSSKPAQVGALAYAQGTNIHLGPGQDRHLPHEAWHVVQQAQGRVKATTSVNGVPVNDSPSLEKEADVMGSKALRS